LRREDPKLLALQQRELLAAAAELARTGGCVVYSVCSLEPEEGEDVVNDFLSLRRDFSLADPRPLLPDPALPLVRPPGYVVTTPARGELDGFFAARLERSSA